MTAADRRQLIRVCAVAATHFASWFVAAPLVALYAARLGASAGVVGLVIAAFSLVPMVVGVPLGAVTDRLGPVRIMRWGAGAMTASLLGMGAIPTLEGLLLTQVAAGVASFILIVGAQTFVAALGAPKDRDRNFGLFTFTNALGHVIGPPLGGAVADGLLAASGDPVRAHRGVFLVAAVLALIPLVAALLLKERADGPRPPRSVTEQLSRLPPLVRHPSVAAALFASTAMMFAFGIRRAFYPVYLESAGLSAFSIGLLFSVQSLASMAVRPFLARAVARTGRISLLFGAMLLAAAGWGTVPLWRAVAPLAGLAALTGIALGFSQPLTMVMVANAAGRDVRGLAMGFRLTLNRVGAVLSPILFGLVVGALGLPLAFYGAGLALAAAAVVVPVLARWNATAEAAATPEVGTASAQAPRQGFSAKR